MVQRALNRTELREHIDWLLDYLFGQWEDVPWAACEWATWDGIEREVYLLEWAIPHGHLRELEAQVEAGALSDGQMVRYRELRDLITLHTPELERLFAEE